MVVYLYKTRSEQSIGLYSNHEESHSRNGYCGKEYCNIIVGLIMVNGGEGDDGVGNGGDDGDGGSSDGVGNDNEDDCVGNDVVM